MGMPEVPPDRLIREGEQPESQKKKKRLGAFFSGALVGIGVFTVIAFALAVGFVTHWEKQKADLHRDIAELESRVQELVKKDKKTVVPIIKKLRPQLDDNIAEDISKAIIKYSFEYRIPPEFVVYLMQRESRFDVLAKSKASALGLMQVLPQWHKDKMDKMGITKNEVYHIDNNVKLGCWILRGYINETGSIEKALTKYVGGTHESYVKDILIGFTNEMIPKKEITK